MGRVEAEGKNFNTKIHKNLNIQKPKFNKLIKHHVPMWGLFLCLRWFLSHFLSRGRYRRLVLGDSMGRLPCSLLTRMLKKNVFAYDRLNEMSK